MVCARERDIKREGVKETLKRVKLRTQGNAGFVWEPKRQRKRKVQREEVILVLKWKDNFLHSGFFLSLFCYLKSTQDT